MVYNEKDFFNEMARKYQENAVLVPQASRLRNLIIDKAMKRGLLSQLKSLRHMTILEVGCGVGRWTRIMSISNLVVAMDISREMIRISKDACKNERQVFLVADAAFLPFKEDIFDLVISITVLQHILELERLSRSIYEICRCSKVYVILFEEMWSNKELLLEKGFCPIRIRPIKNYIKDLQSAGLHVGSVRGITFSPLMIFFIRLFAFTDFSQKEARISEFRNSKVFAWLFHSLMGISILPGVFMPKRNYLPCLSLHTMILANKLDYLKEAETALQY